MHVIQGGSRKNGAHGLKSTEAFAPMRVPYSVFELREAFQGEGMGRKILLRIGKCVQR